MRIKVFLLSIVLTSLSFVSFATDYYTATTALNVRNGAGTEYSVSFSLKKGDEVEVLSKNNSWYRIKYFEKTGYVHSKYLNYSRTIPDVPLEAPKQKASYFPIVFCLGLALVIGIFIYLRIRDKKLLETVTESNRGVKSERDLVLKLLKFGMPAEVIFHDLYVEKINGGFSQIDLVTVTEVGVIVFEVKDYSGWLYGNGNQSQWTQVLAYGRQKYCFYNPIMQNNKHIAELRNQLAQFGNLPLYSVVVFYGNCVFKEINFVPSGTLLVKSERVLEVVKSILRENKAFDYTDVAELFRVLKQSVINGGIIENQVQHQENIKEMLGENRIFD
jgi:uncharacterized protein YraI